MLHPMKVATATLLLAALPAPALAECAWVLWADHHEAREPSFWSIYGATETRPECLALLEVFAGSQGKLAKEGPDPGVRIRTSKDQHGEVSMHDTFYCLPAGTDPRPRARE